MDAVSWAEASDSHQNRDVGLFYFPEGVTTPVRPSRPEWMSALVCGFFLDPAQRAGILRAASSTFAAIGLSFESY